MTTRSGDDGTFNPDDAAYAMQIVAVQQRTAEDHVAEAMKSLARPLSLCALPKSTKQYVCEQVAAQIRIAYLQGVQGALGWIDHDLTVSALHHHSDV